MQVKKKKVMNVTSLSGSKSLLLLFTKIIMIMPCRVDHKIHTHVSIGKTLQNVS